MPICDLCQQPYDGDDHACADDAIPFIHSNTRPRALQASMLGAVCALCAGFFVFALLVSLRPTDPSGGAQLIPIDTATAAAQSTLAPTSTTRSRPVVKADATPTLTSHATPTAQPRPHATPTPTSAPKLTPTPTHSPP